MLSPTRLCFLNEERDISAAANWNSSSLSKLWLYNLHYFYDLNAEGAEIRTVWHRALMSRWIKENPPGQGIGWEPYPLSLRIVNWIKWARAGNALDEGARYSLAVQVRFLTRRLERHLLGNHLFSNAKALIFAGCYFEGEEAEDWLKLGMSILSREIPEQILADGGHFERSTMYHALAYEDMLDLVNLAQAYPGTIFTRQASGREWQERVGRMGAWLRAMCHPDGEIAFFNDAAVGIAPVPNTLFSYAERLGAPILHPNGRVVQLNPSGYIRVSLGQVVAMIDAASIGPDYLPGHAHADTLSFELSLHGQRVMVNSGTSRYGDGPEREWERSTAAHNTITINNENSSEVWDGFRVGRRASPSTVEIYECRDKVLINVSHDGYKRLAGKNVHHRRWQLSSSSILIEDRILGRFQQAVARFYLHPAIKTKSLLATSGIQLILPEGQVVEITAEGGRLRVEDACWHPQFGLSIKNQCLTVDFTQSMAQLLIRLDSERSATEFSQ